MIKKRSVDNQKVKDDQKKRKGKSMENKRTADNPKVKEFQKKRKGESRNHQRAQDNQKVKDDQKNWKGKSMEKKRAADTQKVKNDQNKRKKLSRNKRKIEDPKGLSKLEIDAKKKRMRLWNAEDRLREFKEATKYNAIFICSCCERRLFHSNVQIITQKLRDDINRLKPGHFRDCVETDIETAINGKNDCYICNTCVDHMKKKNLPPMSAKNSLTLHKQDESLKLTELEGALIAKNIIFQKIHQLPKSRWTALTDRIINVPINDEDVLNTIELLPRTPKEAGLIGVSLKRKLEYKNTHKRQLVDPNKILRMLDILKRSGNPYYQFHEDLETYQERCKQSDPEGYEVIFPNQDALEDELEKMPEKEYKSNIDDEILQHTSTELDNNDVFDEIDSDDDSDDELRDEMDYIENDPARKFQFTYK